MWRKCDAERTHVHLTSQESFYRTWLEAEIKPRVVFTVDTSCLIDTTEHFLSAAQAMTLRVDNMMLSIEKSLKTVNIPITITIYRHQLNFHGEWLDDIEWQKVYSCQEKNDTYKDISFVESWKAYIDSED